MCRTRSSSRVKQKRSGPVKSRPGPRHGSRGKLRRRLQAFLAGAPQACACHGGHLLTGNMPTGRPLRGHLVLTTVLQGCPIEDLEPPHYIPRKLHLPLIELSLTAPSPLLCCRLLQTLGICTAFIPMATYEQRQKFMRLPAICCTAPKRHHQLELHCWWAQYPSQVRLQAVACLLQVVL